mmetsp:Transcript_46/g.122  ORF Transcript_46/g.122 Transcript_46/m.122 type:complete len:414 (-) Transcript_46:1-1242(-)
MEVELLVALVPELVDGLRAWLLLRVDVEELAKLLLALARLPRVEGLLVLRAVVEVQDRLGAVHLLAEGVKLHAALRLTAPRGHEVVLVLRLPTVPESIDGLQGGLELSSLARARRVVSVGVEPQRPHLFAVPRGQEVERVLLVAHMPELVDRLCLLHLLLEGVELDAALPLNVALCVTHVEGMLSVPGGPEVVHGLRPLHLRLVRKELGAQLLLPIPRRLEVEGVLAVATVPVRVHWLDVRLALAGCLEAVNNCADVGLPVHEAVKLEGGGNALPSDFRDLNLAAERQDSPPHIEVQDKVVSGEQVRALVALGVVHLDVLDLEAPLEGIEAQVANLHVNAEIVPVELLQGEVRGLDEHELQQQGAHGQDGHDQDARGQPAGERSPGAAQVEHCQREASEAEQRLQVGATNRRA